MDWLIFAIYGLVFGAPAISGIRRQVWERRALSIGFEVKSNQLDGPKLIGDVRGHLVTVTRSKHRLAVRIPGMDTRLTLGRDGALARAVQSDIEIGDPEFDDVVRVEGDRDFALGLMCEDARRAVLRLVRDVGGTAEGGKIEVLVYRFKDIPEVLEPMADVADHLRERSLEELPALMAHIALEDSSPEVRLRVFRQLSQEFHGSAELPETARELLGSSDVALRLEAADRVLWIGSERNSTLDRDVAARVLTELAAERALDMPTRRRALESLARSDRAAVAVPVCRQILSVRLDEPPELRRAAVATLVKAKAAHDLVQMNLRSDLEEMELIARGLGQLALNEDGPLDRPAIQARLLDLLAYPEERVQIAAATSLGVVGDIGAVEALRQAAGAQALYKSPLARAVETAVQRIQGRLGGSQAGEISLSSVSSLEGAVSTAEDETSDTGGEVSLS